MAENRAAQVWFCAQGAQNGWRVLRGAVGGNNGDLLICDREGTRCKATRTVRGSMEGKRRGAVRFGVKDHERPQGCGRLFPERVLQRGARSGRLALRGSKVVWPVCDLQREWVGTKVIGENRRGKCEVCAEIA